MNCRKFTHDLFFLHAHQCLTSNLVEWLVPRSLLSNRLRNQSEMIQLIANREKRMRTEITLKILKRKSGHKKPSSRRDGKTERSIETFKLTEPEFRTNFATVVQFELVLHIFEKGYSSTPKLANIVVH